MRPQMTAKERLVAALSGQPVDYLPFSPFLAYVWENFPQAIQSMGQLEFHHQIGATPLWRGAPCPVQAVPPDIEIRTSEQGATTLTEIETAVGSLRQMQRHSEMGNTTFLVEHPIKTVEDFKVQLWIEEHTSYRVSLTEAEAHFAGSGQEGLSIGMLIPRGKTAFQWMIEHAVGTEELAYALADHPGVVEELWQAMVQGDLEAARLAAGTGAYTIYLTWEDSGTQNYSPRQYERYIASEIREWCTLLEAEGRHYIQHACGHVKALLPMMKASGVYAVESISPPPTGNLTLREARAVAGNDFGIIGGIEPTQFLNLSPAQLAPYVEQVIADGQGGPFVLANSDSCPPGVTMEKFKLIADIARRHAP